MAIAGPRLDRPSAVGDEGRPRATSLSVATLVVVGCGLAVGFVAGDLTLILTLATVAGPAAAGIALLDRERLGHAVVGHAITLWFGSALVVMLLWQPVATGGLIVALFGIGITWADAGTAERLQRTVSRSSVTYGFLWGWVLVLLAVVVAVALAIDVVSWSTERVQTSAGLVILAGYVFFAAGNLLLALRWLPIQALVGPARHGVLDQIRIGLIGIVAASGLLIVSWFSYGFMGVVSAISPPPTLAAPAAALEYAIQLLALTGGIGLLGGVSGITLRRVTRQQGGWSRRTIAALLAGLVSAVMVVLATLIFGPLALAGALLAPLPFLIASVMAVVAASLKLLPDRSGGPAIAALGLLVTAIGVASVQPVVAFTCVAGAAVVWDLSWFGMGLTAELGHRPETRRLELVHATGVLGVGVLAVISITALYAGLQVIGPVNAPILLVVAVGLVLALLVALRG